MPGRREIIWVERYEVSPICVAAVVAYQGRQEYMEDRFSVITNINNSQVSLYAIFDGHAGGFAADYCSGVVMPSISEKISELLDMVKLRTQKPVKKSEKEVEKQAEAVPEQPSKNEEPEVNSNEPEVNPLEPEVNPNEPEVNQEPEVNPLEQYITPDHQINYEKLLHDEILAFDGLLLQRMAKAALFCGTTANIVLVDLTNKLIICANVGDSRAVMCDAKGNAFPLSHDHKPNNPEEMTRIRDNGGTVQNKAGCWRVEGTLACSRSIGDYPLKQKKVIIADPDIIKFKFKDFK